MKHQLNGQHMQKKLWKAYPNYLKWKEDHGAVKFEANTFANIIGRVNEDGAWAAIKQTKAKNQFTYNEFYGLPTESQNLYGGQMSTHCEKFFTKVILKEANLESDWENFVSEWNSSGGKECSEEINAWYAERK